MIATCPDDLTPRQREVLRLVSNGYSAKEIARCLGTGVRTVKGHLNGAYRRILGNTYPTDPRPVAAIWLYRREFGDLRAKHSRRIGPPRPLLSPRQESVLALIARGLSDKQIARHLGLAYDTIKNCETVIYARLPLGDAGDPRVAAARWHWERNRETA